MVKAKSYKGHLLEQLQNSKEAAAYLNAAFLDEDFHVSLLALNDITETKGGMSKLWVEYDNDAKIFHGEMIAFDDMITFQGRNIEELQQAFKDSVDDYLNWCKERGEKPEKTFSGTPK